MTDHTHTEEARRPPASHMVTVLGWVAGALLGFLVNTAVWLASDHHFPFAVGCFVWILVGAFGGMRLSDRWGQKSIRWFALTIGVLLSCALFLFLGWFSGLF